MWSIFPLLKPSYKSWTFPSLQVWVLLRNKKGKKEYRILWLTPQWASKGPSLMSSTERHNDPWPVLVVWDLSICLPSGTQRQAGIPPTSSLKVNTTERKSGYSSSPTIIFSKILIVTHVHRTPKKIGIGSPNCIVFLSESLIISNKGCSCKILLRMNFLAYLLDIHDI